MRLSLILLLTAICCCITGCGNGAYRFRITWKIPIDPVPKPLNNFELGSILDPSDKNFRRDAVIVEGQLFSQYIPIHEYDQGAHMQIRDSEKALKKAIATETKARHLAKTLKRRKSTFADFQRFVEYGQAVRTEYGHARRCYLYFYYEHNKSVSKSDIEGSYLEYRWPLIAQYNAKLRLNEIKNIKTLVFKLKDQIFPKKAPNIEEIKRDTDKLKRELQRLRRHLSKNTVLSAKANVLVKEFSALKKLVLSADDLQGKVSKYVNWASKSLVRNILYDPTLKAADRINNSVYLFNRDANRLLNARIDIKTKQWQRNLTKFSRKIYGLTHRQAIRFKGELQSLEQKFDAFRAGEEALLAYVDAQEHGFSAMKKLHKHLIQLYKKLKPFMPKANQRRLRFKVKEEYESIGIQDLIVFNDSKGIEEIALVKKEDVKPVPVEEVQLASVTLNQSSTSDVIEENGDNVSNTTVVMVQSELVPTGIYRHADPGFKPVSTVKATGTSHNVFVVLAVFLLAFSVLRVREPYYQQLCEITDKKIGWM